MFLKKLLATVASIALTGGALLGVATPAFAEDAVPSTVEIASVAEASSDASASDASASEVPSESLPAEDPASAQQAPPAEVAVPEEVVASDQKTARVEEPAPTPSAAQPDEPTALLAPSVPLATTQSQPETVSRANDHNQQKKVWVCKVVSSNKSPYGFRLQTGNQPIYVSENSLGRVNDSGTFQFNDKQPSFVVAEDDFSLCWHSEDTVKNVVDCTANNGYGIVNVTTTTTFYLGTTVAQISVKKSTRGLTEMESLDCAPPPVMVYVCQFRASNSHPSGWVLRSSPQPVLTSSVGLGGDLDKAVDFDPARSWFVVPSDDRSLCASETKEVVQDVMCPTADSGGHATITTTKTYFYGTVQVKQRITEKMRDLTKKESRECPPIEEPLVATAAIDFLAASCEAPQQLVLGDIENATWGEVADLEVSDSYSVTATADAGAQFAGGLTELTFTGVLVSQWDPFSEQCDLVTLGLVMPAVTFAQASCSVGGSYTLGVSEGYDASSVTFTVNGVSGVIAGTYPIAASGPVMVTAQVAEPNGYEPGWEHPPVFSFVIPSDDDCTTVLTSQVLTSQLPTLAYTGGGVSLLWWLLPVSMIVLGAAAFTVRRRTDADVS